MTRLCTCFLELSLDAVVFRGLRSFCEVCGVWQRNFSRSLLWYRVLFFLMLDRSIFEAWFRGDNAFVLAYVAAF